jgi:predicted secreted protein
MSATATVKVGAVLTINLSTDGSDGGYLWGTPAYEASALVLLPDNAVPSSNLPGLPGAPGTQVWQFRGLATSSSTIAFADNQPWETGVVPPILNVVVTVHVSS